MSADLFDPTRPHTCKPSHAARELGLKPGDFDRAVQLGCIRTVPDEGGGGGRRVERAEIERVRAQDGFPESLLDRVRVVGTAEGAALMEIPAGRFTRLARLGLLVPAAFYLNRYRAVVWLYLAEELRQFAAEPENARLLKGRTPETLRGQLTAGVDLRARNWRGRHLGLLLRRAEDPWARAAAVAAFLTPVDVADIVRDPYERAQLNRFRPMPAGHGVPGSPVTHATEQITTAQDADEIGWLRSELARLAEEARSVSSVARPAARPLPPVIRTAPRPIPPMARTVTGPAEETSRFPKPAASSPGPDGFSPESTQRLPEPAAWAEEPWTRPTWSTARSCEPVVRPPEPMSASRPAAPTAPRGHGTAQPGPRRSPRGLRAWLRRRSPRRTGAARV
ncbi:DUF6397 family protein [Streptomyces rubradiris]|uniref:Uncharacterized protein n=1 Tax=Streptomyces rubradiris TaxID=285531 RepID=A0ABQ3R4N0_STRRR|nr:hypothetical protein GCM10018792_25840 [Streptomyces rubradiris]GHI50832.1 hypothetical protein Srubr_06780 [Streptomyces rubradiris]